MYLRSITGYWLCSRQTEILALWTGGAAYPVNPAVKPSIKHGGILPYGARRYKQLRNVASLGTVTMPALDETDRSILGILARSGREPLKRLASMVGLSRSAMTARLRRLERDGIIQGYCAVLSSAAHPRPNQAVLLVRVAKTPAYDVIDALSRVYEVVQCRSVAGDIDLVVDVAAESIAALNRVRDDISALPGVADVRTHLILATNFKTLGD